MPLEGLIDIVVEKNRLVKEITRIEGLLKSIVSKLGNEKFVANAPPDVVEHEQLKQRNFTLTIEKLKENLTALEADA